MTLVQADLENKESLFSAIKGADYVIHTASPFPLKKPKNETPILDEHSKTAIIIDSLQIQKNGHRSVSQLYY